MAIAAILCLRPLSASGRSAARAHTVVLGAAKKVPYSKAGDPAGAAPDEDPLKIRALLVDGGVKEWTTGDAHDVTDRSFVVRRVIRLNDALPRRQAQAALGVAARPVAAGGSRRPATSPRSSCPTTIPA